MSRVARSCRHAALAVNHRRQTDTLLPAEPEVKPLNGPVNLNRVLAPGLQEARVSGGAPVNAPPVVASASTPVFEFQALAALPCGCVAAAFRSEQWDVAMISLEAKGPHCLHASHHVGHVLDLHDLLNAEIVDEVVHG
jgi:hypothetical protein